MIEPLSKEELAWVKKLQKLLDKPPSDRLRFYTIGDRDVNIYDKFVDERDTGDMDLIDVVREYDGHLGSLAFPSNVSGVCG